MEKAKAAAAKSKKGFLQTYGDAAKSLMSIPGEMKKIADAPSGVLNQASASIDAEERKRQAAKKR